MTVLSTASLQRSFATFCCMVRRVQRSSDVMIVSDTDLPSKPSSKCMVTSHSLQPASPTAIIDIRRHFVCCACFIGDLLPPEAKLLILTIAHPDAWEVLFHVELCNVLHMLTKHGVDWIYHTPCRVPSQFILPREIPLSECRGDLTVQSTSPRIVQHTLDWGHRRVWSFAPRTVLDVVLPKTSSRLTFPLTSLLAAEAAAILHRTFCGVERYTLRSTKCW